MGQKKNKAKILRQTIKYLAVCPHNKIVKQILQTAPESVIRAISNAALNAREGEVFVPPQYKSLFARHHKHFDILTDRRRPLQHKRRLLVQHGGALPIVVPLIATVLGSIGGEFISRIFKKNE